MRLQPLRLLANAPVKILVENAEGNGNLCEGRRACGHGGMWRAAQRDISARARKGKPENMKTILRHPVRK